jgi:hypothetical protein
MDVLDRLSLPRRLSAKVWLISLPSALVSFEKRSRLPPIPLGGLRFLGLPLMAAGAALTFWAWRNPEKTIAYDGPLSHLARRPATAGGLFALGGLALLLRSTVLAAYTIGLAVFSGAGRVTIEDPDIEGFLGRK